MEKAKPSVKKLEDILQDKVEKGTRKRREQCTACTFLSSRADDEVCLQNGQRVFRGDTRVRCRFHVAAAARKKVTLSIEELEAILQGDEDVPIQILPNGEIVASDKGGEKNGQRSPLTYRENLGGEYACL